MKVTTLVCDVCKQPSITSIQLFSEYEKDIASGRTEDIYDHVDLCKIHLVNVVGSLLHNVDLSKQAAALKKLKSGKCLTGEDFRT